MGMRNFSFRAHVAWNARKQEDLLHWMQAPSRMSHTEHLCRVNYQLEARIGLIMQRTSFHRCFGILSASVIGSINVSFMTLVSGIQMAHKRWTQSPSTVCLNAPPSLGHKIHDWETKAVKVTSKKEVIQDSPPGFLARRCTYGTAIDLQECMVHRSSLDAQQDCTHHKTRSRSCSRPPSRRKWHKLNPPMALPYPAWASFLSACKVQVRKRGNMRD